jgi:hypothetical protein
MDEQIQPLNYCVRALESLRERVPGYRSKAPKSARQMQRVATALDKSVKFLLPNCAQLIDTRKLTESHFDMLRLPFPIVALEAPWKIEHATLIESGHMQETPSTRRIVLAWEDEMAHEVGICSPAGEPGIWVVALYYQDEGDDWQVAPLAAFLPRGNSVVHEKDLAAHIAAGAKSDQIIFETLIAEGLANDRSRACELFYRPVLPEFCEAMVDLMGPETATARMQLDVRDEVCAVWEFTMTVNCVNVRQEDVEPSPALNRKRVKSGKLPFFTYKVLQLPAESVTHGKGSRGQLEGERTGPRMHLRRGHPRRLPSGKMTYVRAAIIGSAQKGLVEKSYQIR